MPEELFVIPMEIAKGCLEQCKGLSKRAKEIIDNPEATELSKYTYAIIIDKGLNYEKFIEEINSFIDYMNVMVETGVDPIRIPDQHKRIYTAIVESKMKMMIIQRLLGGDSSFIK